MSILTNPNTVVVGTTGTAEDVTLNFTNKTITINTGVNITSAGSTGGISCQALYSALKDYWKTNATAIKYPFCMEAITPEQFEFLYAWKPVDDTSRKLIRTAGWAEKDATNANVLRKYFGVISLGSMGASDLCSYQWGTGSPVNMSFAGPINEAVQVYGGVSDGNFDYTSTAFKLFSRIQGKTYSASDNSAIGASTLGYIAYRFPLSNSTDLKISASDNTIATTTPYTQITVEYFGSDQSRDINGDSVNEGYRYVVTDASGAATTQQIYEKMQWSLRQNTDIDTGAGTVIGQTATALFAFVGDTLTGINGAVIDGLNANYRSQVKYYQFSDSTMATPITYPIVASGTLVFNSNLLSDNAIYRMYGAASFGGSGAVLVTDDTDTPISGNVTGASIPWTFKYTSNNQDGHTTGTDFPVKIVAIGESKGQYVLVDYTIGSGTGQTIAVTAPLERNYVA